MPRSEKEYTLICRQPPLEGSKMLGWPFEQEAQRVRSAKRRMGGFYDLSWRLVVGFREVTEADVVDWFENRLGCRIEQTAEGSIAWQGIVWEEDLSLDGAKYRRSLGEMYNAVKVKFSDEDGEPQETAWFTDDESIDRYFRRELIIPLNDVSQAEAEAEAAGTLTETAYPWPWPLRFDRRLEDRVEVTAAGDVFTANNRYVSAATLDGNTGNISDFVKKIVENDCDFLQVGRITTNTLQSKRSLKINMRAWDALHHLALIGDGNQPWRVWIDLEGHVNYGPADNTPYLEWHGRERGLVDRVGDRSPWAISSWVIRDKTRPGRNAIPGTFLQQSNDSWIYEIEMADGMDYPNPKPDVFDEGEIERAREMNQRWLEMEEEG